jgi:hypothetical protein
LLPGAIILLGGDVVCSPRRYQCSQFAALRVRPGERWSEYGNTVMNQSTGSTAILPRQVEELTADWLSGVFERQGIRARVDSLEQTRIIWGTATKVFVTASFSGPDSGGLPTQLCIKGGFDEQSRTFGLASAYELEADFFREIAPTLDVPLPHCLSAEVEPGQGIIVLEDLTARGVSFPDVVQGLSPDTIARGLEAMAAWQAATWGVRAPRPRWLPVGCRAAREALQVLLQEPVFATLADRAILPPLPSELRNADAVRTAYRALWAEDDAAEQALSHGDAHIGQLYLDPHAGPAFLDWQGACLAPWACDVAYFIGGALSPADRCRHERHLLAHYLEALASRGGPALDVEEAWLSYRQHTLHGFIWAVTPTHLQPEPVVVALAKRYLAAIDDHGPVALLR